MILCKRDGNQPIIYVIKKPRIRDINRQGGLKQRRKEIYPGRLIKNDGGDWEVKQGVVLNVDLFCLF